MDKTAEELAEEAAASVAEADKNKEGEEAAEEEVVEDKKETPRETTEEIVARTIEKIAGLQSKKDLSPEEIEKQTKAIEEESGLGRKSLMFIDRAVKKSLANAVLPFHRTSGQQIAEKALGKYADKLKSKVAEAMAQQPAEVQANPDSWENMAYLIKGKFMEKIGDTDDSDKSDKSSEGRVKGLNNGSGSGAGAKGKGGKQYSADEQTMIANYFEGSSEDYEKSKSSKSIGAAKKQAKQEGGNVADRELARLTGGAV